MCDMFCDWSILYSGHPDASRTIELAELTDMRITEKNGASPKILLIQDKRQEATVESAECRVPTDWGPTGTHNGRVGTPGIPRMCASPAGPPVAATWAFGRHARAVWMAVCLCPSAWQEGRQPLLGAWFGCHRCQEKEAPSCQHNYLCSLHPPFLMWQLSAYRSAQCQGNRGGVGQDTVQPKRGGWAGGGAGTPALGDGETWWPWLPWHALETLMPGLSSR